jgi:hypothetical protein
LWTASCCSSPVQMSPPCCWPEARRAIEKSPSA